MRPPAGRGSNSTAAAHLQLICNSVATHLQLSCNSPARRQKKTRSGSGLKSISLEGSRGDRHIMLQRSRRSQFNFVMTVIDLMHNAAPAGYGSAATPRHLVRRGKCSTIAIYVPTDRSHAFFRALPPPALLQRGSPCLIIDLSGTTPGVPGMACSGAAIRPWPCCYCAVQARPWPAKRCRRRRRCRYPSPARQRRLHRPSLVPDRYRPMNGGSRRPSCTSSSAILSFRQLPLVTRPARC